MSVLVFEILLILLLIAANGILALAEIAIVAARRVRLQQRADNGDAGARVALELASEPTRFLSTVQIGISLVSILAGVFGGATLAESLAAVFSSIPVLAPYAETLGLGVVVLSITYFSLVIGELLPKRLALSDPERFASTIAPSMRVLSTLATPVVSILSASTNVLIRLLRIRPVKESPVWAEEIKILLEQGESAGVFEPTEQDIVESALDLDELRASALITPRTKIVWLDLDAPLERAQATILSSAHAYFPIAHGNLDKVIGVVRGRDVLAQQVLGKPVDLTMLMQPPIFIPESRSALNLLELFKGSGQHMVLVIDEFGGLLGLVTLTDVMQALVGDIHSPGLPHEPAAVRRDDGSWLLSGRLPVQELQQLLDLNTLPEGAGTDYATLGGLIMAMLGRVPTKGDAFEYGQWRFEAVDMDGNRVDQVLATPLLSEESPNTN